VIRRRLLPLLALVGSAAGACSPVDLGPDPDFVWWSDHETGDLSDWQRGGTDFGSTYVQGGELTVTADVARSGTRALRSTVVTPGSAAAQISRAEIAAPAAYYGAWFLLPDAAQPATFWVFFSFHARAAPGNDVPVWDLKLASPGPELQLLRHDTGDLAPLTHVPVPVGRWFQVEAFYRPAADANGRLQIWLDGTPIYDLAGVPTAPANAAEAPVTWSVGSITDGLTPTPATLYVDDAYVSKRRLGPEFPPFWRGE
jgi:hypothetical protein